MYKVLLVDDERIIREGIATTIDWNHYGFDLIGTAPNGFEAFKIIKHLKPDVVITDIKMPLMDGINLISKTKGFDENINFIVLSGYGEFDLANKAMQFGVKHYLIKPCNENKIINVLEDLKKELIRKDRKEKALKNMENSLKKIIPLGKEQFLHDFIMKGEYLKNDFKYYKKLFKIGNDRLRLIILNIEDEWEFKDIHDLKDIINNLSQKSIIYLSTIIKNYLVILIKESSVTEIRNIISIIKKEFMNKNNKTVTVFYSDSGYFDNIPNLYTKTYQNIKYSFLSINNAENEKNKVKLSLLNNEHYSQINNKKQKKYCSLVNKIIDSIYDNYENDNFSLKWLAREIIYMNEGYLSKVFRKDTGEKFSNYLLKVRMDRAIELIINSEDDRVYEVANKIGLGLNPQYFSQLFKKYTGYTPTEYKNIKLNSIVDKVN
ncbi:MAG: response regulator [Clostridiales bacterium]